MPHDVAIVGAGPAGMSAAVALRKHGLSVVVIDEQPAPGGQIWRGVERNSHGKLAQALGADYRKGKALAEAFRNSGADYMPLTQVWQIEDGWSLFVTTNGKAQQLEARTLLLANGAQERPVPFEGWTLPGVMTVGAAQILLKSGGMLPEGKVWIAGAGPLPLLYATQMLDLEGRIEGYLDTSKRPGPSVLRHLPGALRDFAGLTKGMRWLQALKRQVRFERAASGLAAAGENRLETISWRAGGKAHTEPADILLVHEGVVPRIHETMALGCGHVWSADQACFRPRLDRFGETSRKGLFVAGDAGGIGGWAAAAVKGEIAALGIAGTLGIAGDIEAKRRDAGLDARLDAALALRPLLDALYPAPALDIPDDAIVCRCEEVSAGRIRAAARSGPPDPAVAKAATRCGMGPCQGRQCGYAVQALIAEVHDIPQGDVAFFNIRPPLKPVTLGEIASLEEAS